MTRLNPAVKSCDTAKLVSSSAIGTLSSTGLKEPITLIAICVIMSY